MLEAILLVTALSLDAFVASIAYGTNKIRVPITSIAIISTICSFILAISILCGSTVKLILPENFTSKVSFTILLLLGIYYLFESIIKSYLKRNKSLNKKIKLKFSNLQLVLDIYLDETKADFDNSKKLNSKEALYLAIALSIDSLAVGFASSLSQINYFFVVLLSFFAGFFSILIGLFIGRKFADSSKFNLSWLSGVLLLILAVLKLV